MWILLLELNHLVHKADKKRATSDSTFHLKQRVEKSPSHYPKPDNAPAWTFNPATVIADAIPVESTSVAESTIVESVVATEHDTHTPHRKSKGPLPRQILSDVIDSSCDSSSEPYSN